MAIASILFIICGFLLDEKMIHHVDSQVIVAMLYQIFVTASFGMVAWNTMIRRYGATALHSFVYIMPISGVIFGVLILDEPVTYSLIFSLLLIATGLVIVNKPEYRKGK